MLERDIDTTFDFRSDTPPGKDPDKYSSTLRSYHKKLWSKPLPNGKMFDLRDDVSGHYLLHQSALGEFSLSSDAFAQTLLGVKRANHLTENLSETEKEDMMRRFSTIGGYIVFPGKKINGKLTINGARGFSRYIGDRFDLTLECIRLFYDDQPNPLYDVFQRYESFFGLFGDFSGYVRFFHLQDLCSDNLRNVRFWLRFDGEFTLTPFPKDFTEYSEFTGNISEFVVNRARRMSLENE